MKFPSTRRIQRYSLLICGALGAGAGLVFAASFRAAFNVLFATFMWTLIAGTVVAIISSFNGRVARDDWRAGLRLSAEIYFANSTGYLLALLICAALGPAQQIAGAVFNLPTMARIVAPAIYFAASIMTLCSIFFYRRAPGVRARSGHAGRER